MTDLIPVPPAWTPDDTENFLTQFPLPTDFQWDRVDKRGEGMTVVTSEPYLSPVLPNYRLKHGYGFWLRTTPYFPGLFEEIHQILVRAPEDLPLSMDWLCAQLQERRAARGKQQTLF